MFGIIKRNRPIIPTRLPESVDPVKADAVPSEADVPAEAEVVPVEADVVPTEAEVVSAEADIVPAEADVIPAEADVVPADNTVMVTEEPTVTQDPKKTVVTPPLTPTSETNGDGSADEPSVEEPTVEEVTPVNAPAAAEDEDKADDSSDDTRDSEAVTDSEDEKVKAEPKDGGFNYNMFRAWLFIWFAALLGGLVAYIMSIQESIMGLRVGNTFQDEMNLLLVPRMKWDDDAANFVLKAISYTAERVVVVQTDTESCDTTQSCSRLLNAINRKQGPMQYNFMLATDGCLYEGLGWQEPSPLYPDARTMVVAFIGNYEKIAPSTMQLSQLHYLLEASEELKYLSKGYKIVGKKQSILPHKLFAYLATFKYWDSENSDSDGQHASVEFDGFPILDV